MDHVTGTTRTAKTLEYDRGRPATPMVALHYVALVCALGPMVVGVMVFLLYVVTRHFDFAVVGFMTILGGCVATFVGAVCLGVYWYQASRANAEDAAVARRNAKRDLVLMLLNFPLAGVLAFVGITMISHASSGVNVIVRNDDALTAETVLLSTGHGADGGGDAQRLGPIPPGGTGAARVKFGSRGLTATITRGGTSTTHAVFDHMDGDTFVGGGDVRLVIRGGKVEQAQ
jgi:hypothetical protein